MNRRIVASAFACFVALSISNVALASPRAPRAGGTATATTHTKAKLVRFHLRNDSATALTVQVGEQQMTIAAGKTVDIEAQDGLQIVSVNATSHVAAGSLITVVSSMLKGNTVAVS